MERRCHVESSARYATRRRAPTIPAWIPASARNQLGRAPFPEGMKTAYTDGKVKGKGAFSSVAWTFRLCAVQERNARAVNACAIDYRCTVGSSSPVSEQSVPTEWAVRIFGGQRARVQAASG